VLGVRAGLRVGADHRQAVGCLGDRNFGALQQELSVQGPFEPAARLRAVLTGVGRYPLAAGEAGLQDPLTDEDAQARQRLRSVPGHDDRFLSWTPMGRSHRYKRQPGHELIALSIRAAGRLEKSVDRP
jgi:hypothetical protein